MPDYELAEVKLEEMVNKWQRKYDLRLFEVVDMVVRLGLQLYLKERTQSEVNHVHTS